MGPSHNIGLKRHGFLPISDRVCHSSVCGDDESICQCEMTEGYHAMLEEVAACYSSCQDFLTEVSGKKPACQ